MRSGGYKSYLKFIKNKARRLILPYVFVAFLWVVPVSFCFFKWNINVIIHDFALGVNPHHLWFLLMLFEVFVLCWPLWPILTARGVKGAAAILIIFGMGAVLGKVLPNIYCIWTACGYIPFFYIGICMRCRQEDNMPNWIDKISVWKWVLIDIICYIVYISVQERSGIIGVLLRTSIGFLLHSVGAIIAFLVLYESAKRINWKNSRIFQALSVYSMPIYLFHQQLIYFTLTWFDGKVSPYFHVVLNFIFALLGSYTISWVLMRYKFTRFLIGEK